MKLEALVREYLIEIEVRKYTPKTIRGYRNGLNLFLRFCREQLEVERIDEVTILTVRSFSRFMTDAGRKGSYVNGLLKTIKSFLQYCFDEGYGGVDTKKNFKWCKEEKPVIMAFKASDVRQMLQSCKGYDFLSIRDRAVLTALFETGIRCWELCCIQKEDIHDDFIIIKSQCTSELAHFWYGLFYVQFCRVLRSYHLADEPRRLMFCQTPVYVDKLHSVLQSSLFYARIIQFYEKVPF